MPLSLTITGTNESCKVGDILTATVTGGKKPYTYQWLADGTAIPDADGETLAITEDMVGKKISVKVTDVDSSTKTSDESEAVSYVYPELVTAVRKAANSFTANFDSDASEIVKADDITVISEDETDVKKITGLDFSLDGTAAVVTVNTPFKDGVTYNVIYQDSEASFVASVGEVASIAISTSEAEVNTKTPIEFALFDENGVDVTSAVKVDETCIVTFEGDYDNYENTKASKSTVTMTTAGDVCTVTVEYDKNDGVSDTVTASKDITCVSASEKKGTPYFKVAPSDINYTSLCYRFYNPSNSTDTNVSVPVDSTKHVHFYAQDTDKSAIAYDSYEIESADETIATATIDNATGKWASFDVSGNTKGTVLLTLTATKNGTSTTYDIPVTVTDKAAPVKAKLTLSLSTMSNAWDEYYSGEAGVKVYAADGDTADTDLYTVEGTTLKTTGKGIDKDLKGKTIYEDAFAAGDAGFQVTLGGVYTAYAAEGGEYVIEAEVTDLTTGNILTARNTVNVKELPKEAWRASDSEERWYAPKKFEDDGEGLDVVTGLSETAHYKLPWIDGDEYDALEALGADGLTIPEGTLNNTVALKTTIMDVTMATYAGAVTTTDAAVFVTVADDGTIGLLDDADAIELAAAPTLKENVKTVAYSTVAKAGGDPTEAATYNTLETLSNSELFVQGKEPNYTCKPGYDAYAYAATIYEGDGVKANYAIELDDSDKKLGYTATTCTMNAKLAATMGGLFAGYVREDGSIGDGYVLANRASRIINSTAAGRPVNVQTYFGKLLVSENVTVKEAIDLYVTPLNGVGQYGALAPNEDRDADPTELLYMDFITFSDGDDDDRLDLYTAQKDQVLYDNDFAKEGTYKVEFSFWTAGASKVTKESAAFSVKNDLFVPTVTVKSQTLESYEYPNGWAEEVVTDVDLNNNDPTTFSVVELEDKYGVQISDSTTPAKWAVVLEQGVYFHKPLDRTFKLS